MHRAPHFVALAEEGHYGKAAAKLGMDQPMLSRSIMRLEEAFGVQLFSRSARAVTLTPAGETFLKEARSLLAQVQMASRVVRRVQELKTGVLNIGFTPVAMFSAVPDIIRAIRERYPEVQITMQEAQSYEHVERLRDGRIDAAFVNGDVIKGGEFEVRVLERTRVVAAAPSGWPIARMKEIRLTDLEDTPLIVVAHDKSPTTYQNIIAACRAAGFVPKLVPGENFELLSRLGMVASNAGVMITSEYTKRVQLEGVTYIPIVDAPDYLQWELVLAWVPRGVTPVLQDVIDLSSTWPPHG